MSQELSANKFFMDKLTAIEARLSSIEKLLSAESKPVIGLQSECAIPMFDDRGMSLIPDGSDPMKCGKQDHPEWRPMSEAPSGMKITVLTKGKILFTQLGNGESMCTCWFGGNEIYYVELSALEGWRPL